MDRGDPLHTVKRIVYYSAACTGNNTQKIFTDYVRTWTLDKTNEM